PEIDNEEDDEDEDLNDDIINEGIEDPIESDEKFKFTIIEFLQNLEKLSATYKKLVTNSHKNIKIKRHIKNLNNILSKPAYIFLMHFLDNDTFATNDKIK